MATTVSANAAPNASIGTWALAGVGFAIVAANVDRGTAFALALLLVLGALVINNKNGGNFVGDITQDFSNQ